jgi:hypothetical protein
MTVTDRRPCKMKRGDLRRVPQNAALGLIGYHVACPRCGFVTPAVVGDAGLLIVEDAPGVTFSRAVTCLMCLVELLIQNTECTVHEGPGVRFIR